MNHGPFPVGLLDLLVVGVPLHAQDLVEVLPLGLLQLQLRLLQQVPGEQQQHGLVACIVSRLDPDLIWVCGPEMEITHKKNP